MNKNKKLTDGEILSVIGKSIASGVRFVDSRLSVERKQTQAYYDGKLPAPYHKGNASYVSTDVFDTVEAMKATLVETFSASSDIVRFSPKGQEDVPLAMVATAYAKHVVFEQNPGLDILQDVIHDGLLNRIGVAKVYWEKCEETIEDEVEGKTEDDIAVLLSDEEIVSGELMEDPQTGLLSGTITRKVDKSQVRIVVLPPEEFIIDPAVKNLTDAPFISHRTEKTRSELIKEGYDKAKIDELRGQDNELSLSDERISRYLDVADTVGMDEAPQEATETFVIYETYGELDINNSGAAQMYRVVHCGSVLLEKERVDTHPFRVFSPLSTPHSFLGSNFAARVIPTQNSKTVLTRSILDHAVIANNPRMAVVKGALTNPRELLDNRLGGLVNVTRADGIFPLPQAPLNPFVFQTINMLDENKEDVSGVSRLSQGLNKDALSSQNAQGMVEQLISASMQRQKSIARNFASQFLGPLFLDVYRLVIENEKAERIIAVSGQFIPVTPSQWVSQRDISIDFRLGYGERDRQAMEVIQIGQMLGSDPAIAHLYGPEQRYHTYQTALLAKGYKDVSNFLADPQQAKPPEPNPMQVLEMEKLKKELEIMDRKQTLAEQKESHKEELETMRIEMDKRFRTLEFMLETQASERKAAEVENRIEVSQVEMALATKAQEEAPDENNKATAIISPNG